MSVTKIEQMTDHEGHENHEEYGFLIFPHGYPSEFVLAVPSVSCFAYTQSA